MCCSIEDGTIFLSRKESLESEWGKGFIGGLINIVTLFLWWLISLINLIHLERGNLYWRNACGCICGVSSWLLGNSGRPKSRQMDLGYMRNPATRVWKQAGQQGSSGFCVNLPPLAPALSSPPWSIATCKTDKSFPCPRLLSATATEMLTRRVWDIDWAKASDKVLELKWSKTQTGKGPSQDTAILTQSFHKPAPGNTSPNKCCSCTARGHQGRPSSVALK